MRSPVISVIVTAYNEEAYIGRCLRSLLNQSLSRDNYEIIVVNDASTDQTEYALKVFGDDIRALNNERNLSLPASINRGIKAARGAFIVRVDADDYVNREFLNFLYVFLSANPKYDAVACDYITVDHQENVLERHSAASEPIGCGILFSREQLIDIGLYDPVFKRHEERELRFRFDKRYTMGFLELPLYRYRQHENNITKNVELMNEYETLLLDKHGKFE